MYYLIINKMKKVFLFLSVCLIGFALLAGCSKDNGEDEGEVGNASAPQSLPAEYTFATGANQYSPGTGDTNIDRIFFRIKTSTQGIHGLSIDSYDNSYVPRTNYSYRKTGTNTASFSCSCKQILPAPTGTRTFNYDGTLTWSSENVCTYECVETSASGTTSRTYTFWIYK